MKHLLEKLFGGIEMTWPKVIIFAILSGIYTAAMALIPAVQNTSFATIAVTFEVWILLALIIIMNSKSNLDAALKCFVFFLISQPIVYLIQVPFSSMGWGLFGYYTYWFIWTVLCFPMAYLGYFMKKDKWWGYLILLPLIALTGLSLSNYFNSFLFCCPRFALISLFCAAAMIGYPLAIFKDKRVRLGGAIVGAIAVVAIVAYSLLNPPVQSNYILSSDTDHRFDDTYTVTLADPSYGDVSIEYYPGIEDYMVHANFKKAGETVMTIASPDGQKQEFDVTIDLNTNSVNPR